MPIPALHTARLQLRPWRAEDADPMIEMHSDLDVIEFVNGGVPQPPHQTWEQLASFIGHWELRGHGPWAVADAQTGNFLGYAGIFSPAGWPQPELGWALRREAWGHGYATEAASAAMTYAFEVLGLDEVVSYIKPGNARSVAVAHRLGQGRTGSVEVGGSTRDRFAIGAADWSARRR